ncbi:RES domain-containing protein [Microbacterium sp. 179-I 3D4 NHS]|uniref:RES domain-containing protein n=1 Tax=Microbacterium sp. 179-I 3D4 NHS TaxID=3142381 RepID=UPI0039A0F50A
MLVYRVFYHQPNAKPGQNGHPLYLHKPQGRGRWDNTDLYDSWYLAKSPEGAIGETFGDLARWTPRMFDTGTPGVRRALATFTVPDDLALFDFDDPANLLRIGMRPSEVVIRNRPAGQRRAAAIFDEKNPAGARTWQGLQWWSYHRPHWTNLMLWSTTADPAPITLTDITALSFATPAVVDAATALSRPLP